jgi:DNA-binding XRE family transcriptional regulator
MLTSEERIAAAVAVLSGVKSPAGYEPKNGPSSMLFEAELADAIRLAKLATSLLLNGGDAVSVAAPKPAPTLSQVKLTPVNTAVRANAQVLARNLKSIRIANGLSQSEVAELSGLGSSAISRFENGVGRPRGSSIARLASAFGVKPSDLYAQPETKRGEGRDVESA